MGRPHGRENIQALEFRRPAPFRLWSSVVMAIFSSDVKLSENSETNWTPTPESSQMFRRCCRILAASPDSSARGSNGLSMRIGHGSLSLVRSRLSDDSCVSGGTWAYVLPSYPSGQRLGLMEASPRSGLVPMKSSVWGAVIQYGWITWADGLPAGII